MPETVSKCEHFLCSLHFIFTQTLSQNTQNLYVVTATFYTDYTLMRVNEKVLKTSTVAEVTGSLTQTNHC